jgi:hypothetical protein
LQGVDADTTIIGTTDSTPVESLQQALSQIRLPATIPSLRRNIVTSVSLTFPTDIVSTGVASASFTLVNPFTASINMLRVSSTAHYHNLTLGTIDNVDISGDPIHAGGHSTVTSPTLPLKFNLDPLNIVEIITIAAREKNINLGPLAQMFQFIIDNPNYHPPVSSN